MNDDRHDIIGILSEIVRKETVFYRHYIAEVVNNVDPLNRGRVQVAVPELGIFKIENALWAFPRYTRRMIIPKVGDYVEIYFMGADRNRAVYLEVALEMVDMAINNYDGLPTTSVIFEDENGLIKHDDITGTTTIDSGAVEITGGTIKLNSGTEPYVLGTQLNTYLSTLVSTINTLLGSKLDGGGTPGTLTAPSGILSSTITGK